MALTNYEAAMSFIQSEKDLGRQQFMARAVTVLLRRSAEIGPPNGELDMLFFVQTISDLCDQKENLIRVLSGEDLRWWSEEKRSSEP